MKTVGWVALAIFILLALPYCIEIWMSATPEKVASGLFIGGLVGGSLGFAWRQFRDR